MRQLILSISACACVFSATCAMAGGGGGIAQVPVGQTFLKFWYPLYDDNNQLKEAFYATSATGKTDTRAETTDLKIEVYDAGKVSLTITSPKADLYLNSSEDGKERKMRTKDTVKVVNDSMVATAQVGDFDQIARKYIMRTNVKVILKNFDIGKSTATTDSTAAPAAPETAPSTPHAFPMPGDAPIDSPGATSTPPAPLPSTAPTP